MSFVESRKRILNQHYVKLFGKQINSLSKPTISFLVPSVSVFVHKSKLSIVSWFFLVR